MIYALTNFLAAGSKAAVSAVFKGFIAAVSALWDVINRFFTWLLSLLPLPEMDTALEPEPAASSVVTGELEKMEFPLETLYIILGVIGLLILALGVFLIIRHRKVKIGLPQTISRRVNAPGVRGWRRSETPLSFACTNIKFKIMSFRYRNTPPGVLVRLEKFGRKSGAPRLGGESFREYLGRLSPDGQLTPLSDSLDAMYYGKAEKGLGKNECRRIRKNFFHSVRRQTKPKTI